MRRVPVPVGRRWIACLAVLTFALAACSSEGADETPTEGAAGTTEPSDEDGPDGTDSVSDDNQSVRFLMAENFWADWTPYSSTALSQKRLERQIYDYLVEFPSGDLSQPEPSLATEWTQIDDTVWEFSLRDDVVFHDGQPLTAADVKASVELASGFSGESAYALTWAPAEAEVVDDHTVRISTEEPFAPMLAELWWTPIVSAQWLEGDADQLASSPNGTGPFRLTEDATNIKTMAPNEDYWRDPPVIDTLVWEYVQDPQTRLNALLSGEAHAIDRVPPEHLETIEAEDGVELTSVTGIESVNLFVREGRLPIWDESADFRRAVNQAFDRGPLVDNLVMGASSLAGSFLPTNSLFYEEQSPPFAADPEGARAALEAAGAPDGGPEFEIWVAEGFLPRAVPVVEAIAAQMAEVGLKPTVITSDVAGLIDDAFGENGTGAMYHLSWATAGDPNQAAAVYSSAFAWYFGDEELDALVAEGRTTLDPEERAAVYSELQSHMWAQAWHVPLYNSDFTVGHVSELEGVLVQPNGFRTDFYQASLGG
ncbi:MAG: ABC transporter substrate-binding protein [Gemmatimonadetes bacterium]|nr:ABC transporter substrate-binding protein [Gemmatimonadota bacterium]